MIRKLSLKKYNVYHNINYDMVQKFLAKAVKSKIITSTEKDFIEKHFYKIRSTKGSLEVTRMKKIATHLVAWRKYYGINEEYTKITIDDIDEAIFYISHANSQTGRPFRQTTLNDYVTILKGFMTFLIESGNSEISKKDIKNIKISLYDPTTKAAKDILTQSEVMKIIGSADTNMYKAVFSLIHDVGIRSGEIIRLKWNQIEFNDRDVYVNVSENPQKPKIFILTFSANRIKKWREEYPFELKNDGYVFLTEDNCPLTHKTLSAQFKLLLKKSGLKKHYTMLSLRHARIVHLSSGNLSLKTIMLLVYGMTDVKEYFTHISRPMGRQK